MVAAAPRWAVAQGSIPSMRRRLRSAIRSNGEIVGPVQNFRWNDGPARGFNNITMLGRPVPMHIGEAYDNPGTALVPAMKIEDFRMTSISPAV
jgi:predicted Zn-dependent protease